MLGHLCLFDLFIRPLTREIWVLIFVNLHTRRSRHCVNYIPPLPPPNNVEGCEHQIQQLDSHQHCARGKGGWFQNMVVKCPNTFFHDCLSDFMNNTCSFTFCSITFEQMYVFSPNLYMCQPTFLWLLNISNFLIFHWETRNKVISLTILILIVSVS